MNIHVYSMNIAENENIIRDEAELKPPIPLEYFPNNMGINLCSVKSMIWEETDDGQLYSIHVYFIPAPEKTKEEALQDAKDYGLKSTTQSLKKGVFTEKKNSKKVITEMDEVICPPRDVLKNLVKK